MSFCFRGIFRKVFWSLRGPLPFPLAFDHQAPLHQLCQERQDICAALEKITLETLTPIEAMNELYRLKKMLD